MHTAHRNRNRCLGLPPTLSLLTRPRTRPRIQPEPPHDPVPNQPHIDLPCFCPPARPHTHPPPRTTPARQSVSSPPFHHPRSSSFPLHTCARAQARRAAGGRAGGEGPYPNAPPFKPPLPPGRRGQALGFAGRQRGCQHAGHHLHPGPQTLPAWWRGATSAPPPTRSTRSAHRQAGRQAARQHLRAPTYHRTR